MTELGTGDAPDPHVLRVGDEYFLYTTMTGWTSVPVWRSTDHRTWTWVGDALAALPAWATWGDTWAPSVAELDGRFVLYFTARHTASGRQCIGVAVADRPEGPFSPAAGPLVCDVASGGSIDPATFRDVDGTAYLYWKADANAIGQPCSIWGATLTTDGLGLAGTPVRLLTEDAAWEQPTIENPALVRDPGGTVWLFYSGGWWESATYGIGLARCDGPLGPCTKVTTQQPWYTAAGSLAGIGGESFFVDAAGAIHMAAHAWTAPDLNYSGGGTRHLVVGPVTFGTQPVWHLFTDIGAGVHAADIERAAELGLVAGGGAGQFRPASIVTRGQAATMLGNLLTVLGRSVPAAPDAFADDDGSVHEPAIDGLAALGVFGGLDTGRAGPDAPMTRAQLATLLAATLECRLGTTLPPGPDAFGDDDGSAHESAIDALAALGVVHGIGGGAFAPAGMITRAQAATQLVGAVDAMAGLVA